RGATLGLACLVAACRPAAPVDAAAPAAPTQTPFDAEPYAEGRLADTTRIFLIAGGDDIANFAQEVVTQRALWTEAGAADESVACYWAKPAPEAWEADRDQYEALAAELSRCRRAEPATVRADLRAAAEQAPPWIYVFITSHGLPPLLQWSARSVDRREVARQFEASYAELDAVDQHAVGLQAGPGPRLSQARRILEERRAGAPMGDLMLSPSTLAETLGAFPEATVKVVVIQACFSGGFIGDTTDKAGLSPLTEVPNVVVLTATAHDRPSFGCGAGQLSTYYGGALNKALARHLESGTTPDRLPWETIWEDTAFVVDAMESIDGERPSVPHFFSNLGGSVRLR
ncbi:MAG: hypothetical protein AAF721_39615, partial [Myxococcota bacterium]